MFEKIEYDQIKMSVSPMIRSKDGKSIFVMFQDADRYLEISLPEYKVMSNQGFSEDEVTQIILYAKSEQDNITALAKGINPVKAMMKE